MSLDEEFDRVIAAFARYNGRPRVTPEQRKAAEEKAHREDPRHIAAMKRRKKRKRGGPK